MIKSFYSRSFPGFLIAALLLIFVSIGLLVFYSNPKNSKKTPPFSTANLHPAEPLPASIPTVCDHSGCRTPHKVARPQKVSPSNSGKILQESQQNLKFLQTIMQRNSDTISFTKNPDGSRAADLNGTFKTVSVAKRLPDGTLDIQCFETYEALKAFMSPSQTQ